MKVLAAQYLSAVPEGVSVTDVSLHLQKSLDILPIATLLCGWDLPPKYEEAIAEISTRYGTRLFRWQPWLAGDSHTSIPLEWLPVSSQGMPINDPRALADFTFFCPNSIGVSEFLAERLKGIYKRDLYQGLFLDRIRFPSPTQDPTTALGCFCKNCVRLAGKSGLDLEQVKNDISILLASRDGVFAFIRSLFGRGSIPHNYVQKFLEFRCRSITAIVERVHHQLRGTGIELGLDCFSPSIAYLVGQDLASLDRYCDWIKIMTYPHVNGPAGIPYEISGLVDWLLNRYHLGMHEALSFLGEASGFRLLATRNVLKGYGLDSRTIHMEIASARKAGVKFIFAGIPVVKIKGIHESTSEQLRQDLAAARDADGLILSWDLWDTPLENLKIVHDTWF